MLHRKGRHVSAADVPMFVCVWALAPRPVPQLLSSMWCLYLYPSQKQPLVDSRCRQAMSLPVKVSGGLFVPEQGPEASRAC